MARFSIERLPDSASGQRQALRTIAELIARGSAHPTVRSVAHALTRDCANRDDLCELEAIFEAVRDGSDKVKALRYGMRYVADPRWADFFTGPAEQLRRCEAGACAGDCDDHTILVAALAASLGFKVGARAWGPAGSEEFTHVYAVAAVPKKGPWPKSYSGHGLDTTVPYSSVGWEPKKGHVLTFWVE